MSKGKVDVFVDKLNSQLKNFNYLKNKTLLQWSSIEESKDYYGISAPLESFMGVSSGRLFDHVWNCFELGDVVIGRVISKFDRGLSVRLLCFDAGKSQDIESLEITARCPKSEISVLNNHEDPLSRFSINDLVRGEIINVHAREENLVITFRDGSKFSHGLKFGIITDEALPVAYKRMCSESNSYDKALHFSTGFYNPNVVTYLKERLIPGNFKSLVKDIQTYSCPPSELAPALRKRQSAKVAFKCVAKGINFYRKGQMLEALQELNHALDLDSSNVDALVARGALYANQRTFMKAIADFERALTIDQLNKNAKKYLIETLVERAKSIELEIKDLAQVREASRLYKRALTLDPDCKDAKTALGFLEKKAKKFKKRKNSSTDSVSSSENTTRNSKSGKPDTLLKVRQLLEHDVGQNAKHNRTRSSSSSSSSSSSTSSSSSSSSSDSSSSSSSSDSSRHSPTKRRRTSSMQKRRTVSETGKRNSRRSSSERSSDSDKHNNRRKSTSDARAGEKRKKPSDRRSRQRKNSSDSSRHLPAKRRRTSSTQKRRSISERSKRNSRYSSSERSTSDEKTNNSRRKSTSDTRSSKKRNRSSDQKTPLKNTSSVVSNEKSAKQKPDNNSRSYGGVQKGYSSSKNAPDQASRVDRRRSAPDRHNEPIRKPRRSSESTRSDNRTRNNRDTNITKPTSDDRVSASITKITKDNFSNILDQISKFEKQKSSK